MPGIRNGSSWKGDMGKPFIGASPIVVAIYQ